MIKTNNKGNVMYIFYLYDSYTSRCEVFATKKLAQKYAKKIYKDDGYTKEDPTRFEITKMKVIDK